MGEQGTKMSKKRTGREEVTHLYISRHGSWYSTVLQSPDSAAGTLLVCFTDREEAEAWAGDYAQSRGGSAIQGQAPAGNEGRILGLPSPDEVLPFAWRIPNSPRPGLASDVDGEQEEETNEQSPGIERFS
jgi:hypothetical protein